MIYDNDDNSGDVIMVMMMHSYHDETGNNYKNNRQIDKQ